MTQRKTELLAIPGFALAIALALMGAMPVKELVKQHAETLGPLAGSAGMLASFGVFLLIFFAFAATTALLWKWHQKKEIPVAKQKKVTYGYHTPVPR
jgi:hypothetical protein